MRNEEEQFDTLPPAIIQALRELDGPSIMPDSQRDTDLLAGARLHLASAAVVEHERRRLRRFFAGGAVGVIAAAAMVALVIFIADPPLGPESEQSYTLAKPDQTPRIDAKPGDLDQNGRVDILDAYALARQLNQAQDTTALDFNHDGYTDQRDIDYLANQAVTLSTGRTTHEAVDVTEYLQRSFVLHADVSIR